jgi:hypothetical protein
MTQARVVIISGPPGAGKSKFWLLGLGGSENRRVPVARDLPAPRCTTAPHVRRGFRGCVDNTARDGG